MYSLLALLLMIVLPLPMLISGNTRGESPYRAILKGAIMTCGGIALLFVVSMLLGNSIITELRTAVDSICHQLAPNDQLAQTFKLGDAGVTERFKKYREIYNRILQLTPSSMMISALVISWIEGLIVGKRKTSEGEPHKPVPPMRTLQLPRGAVWGWLFILLASWICKWAGASFAPTLTANVDILFELTFALQGISLVLFFFYEKKIPKVVPILIVIVCWLMPMGLTLLFIVGLLDMMFPLRQRIVDRGNREEK